MQNQVLLDRTTRTHFDSKRKTIEHDDHLPFRPGLLCKSDDSQPTFNTGKLLKKCVQHVILSKLQCEFNNERILNHNHAEVNDQIAD